MSTKVLGPALLTWTQAAQTVFGILQYTDKKGMFSIEDVMGFSGHAFRITIHRETVNPAAPTVYSPFDLMGRTFQLFGFKVEQIGIPTPASPEKLEEFITFVQSSIDKGMPVTGWDLFVPECGIIYGYDHDKQVLYARDVEKDGTIAYSEINNRRYHFLHAMAISDSQPVEMMSVLRESLKRTIAFSKGEFQKPDHEPYRNGLAGFDAWIEAFTNKKIDVLGNSYNLAIIADAREFAVKFLRGFKQKWMGTTELEQQLLKLADEAADYYQQVAEPLIEMRAMFPFPQSGEPNDPVQAMRAIELLKLAKAAEEKGIDVMERILDLLTKEVV